MRKFQSEEVVAMPFLIGHRFLLDYQDEESFRDSYLLANMERLPHDFFPFEGRPGRNFKDILETVKYVTKSIIRDFDRPLAFFYILNWHASNEADWLLNLQQEISQYRENVYVYFIIWDKGLDILDFHARAGRKFNFYLFSTGHAPFIALDPDAPTAGAERVIEFMRRILGYDLSSRTFPDYPMTVINQMAMHINGEDFNFFTPKGGAIPKYPIIDDHPYFPTLFIKSRCSTCGTEIIVPRSKVDSQGNAEVLCEPGCPQFRLTIENIGHMFDPWPEYEELFATT